MRAAFNIPPKATLAIFPAKPASKPIVFLIPICIAVKDPIKTVNPTKNLDFNLLILSTLPSAIAWSKSIPVIVNQPPARVNRKLVNLLKTP